MSQIKDMNEKAEFPLLVADDDVKVEMQSGQHRMTILRQLRGEDDQWWIVTIYDHASNFLVYIIVLK